MLFCRPEGFYDPEGEDNQTQYEPWYCKEPKAHGGSYFVLCIPKYLCCFHKYITCIMDSKSNDSDPE